MPPGFPLPGLTDSKPSEAFIARVVSILQMKTVTERVSEFPGGSLSWLVTEFNILIMVVNVKVL